MHPKDRKIKIDNDTIVTAYPSTRNTMINSNDCTTEYKKINPKSDVYTIVKK